MELTNVSDLFDLPGWLILAKEAEPIFGKMLDNPVFFDSLKQAVIDGYAFCIRDTTNRENCILCGGIIISKKNNSIEWFVVAKKNQGAGMGKKLLKKAMTHLDCSKPVTVETFSESETAGFAARKLYENFGFRDSGNVFINPAGIQTIIMIKPAMIMLSG